MHAISKGRKPSIKTRYKARVAKADADYSVAIEKCGVLAGDAKGMCLKEAKARFGKN